MPARALFNGEPAEGQALLDRSCQYGDGLFETIAVRSGRPCLWSRHVDRLLSGCDRLGIAAPDPELLLAEAGELIAGRQNALLKIVISSGPSQRGYARDPNARGTRWLHCDDQAKRPPGTDEPLLAQECRIRLGSQPLLAGIKHLNRLEQVLASRELQTGRQEGILCNQQGRPVEGIASNILLRFEDHYLTPPLRDAGVAGTVRQLVIDEQARLDLPLRVRDTQIDALYRAEGLFMMNALRGIQPVAKLGEYAYPLTRRPDDLGVLHAACFTFGGEPACAD